MWQLDFSKQVLLAKTEKGLVATIFVPTKLGIDNISKLKKLFYARDAQFFRVEFLNSRRISTKLSEQDFAHLDKFECSKGLETNYFQEAYDKFRNEEENAEIGFNPDSGHASDNEEETITNPNLLEQSWPKLANKYRAQTDDVNIAGGGW